MIMRLPTTTTAVVTFCLLNRLANQIHLFFFSIIRNAGVQITFNRSVVINIDALLCRLARINWGAGLYF